MADNTLLNSATGGDTIATDDLTTLNGGAVSGVKVQRTKVGYGTDGSLRDVDASWPLPVLANPPTNASVGPTAFTAGDAVVAAPVGDGTLVTGASTSGSIVSIAIPSGFTAWTTLVKNWANGTIYSEASFNSTNGTDGDWVEVKGRRTGTAPGTESVVYAFVANGYYRGNGAGFTYYRLRFIGTSTFPTVQITLSEAQGATFLNSGIPAGSSVIGGVTQSGAWTVTGAGGTFPVTGTFYQATQPVSIATMPSTPVTGTFYQATQPVSIATNTPDVTDRSGRLLGTIANTSFAVTNAGTFAVQAAATLAAETSKVIGTVNLSAAQTLATVTTVGAVTAITNALPTGANVIGALTANQSVNAAQINGITPLMGNGVTGTGSQRVTIASDNTAFPVNSTLSAETSKVIGTVNIAASQTLATVTTVGAVTAITNALPTGANTIGAVNIAASQTLATVTTVGAVTAITNALPAGTNKVGTVDIATAAATAKGTQGTNALPVQDLKDAGRNQVHYYTLIPVLTTATDTLQTLTGTKAGATVTATTTPAVVTTAKTFRVTRVAATYISTATSGYAMVRLRYNTAGVVAVTSPIAATIAVGNGGPATANAADTVEAAMDEGWEFAAATGIGISVQGFAAVTATAVGYVLVSVTGYEY